jgi:hypothetical protein
MANKKFGKSFEIVKKAYVLSSKFIDEISEGFYLAGEVVFAENASAARWEFFPIVCEYDRMDREDFEFIQIRVVREKEADIIKGEGSDEEMAWREAWAEWKREQYRERIQAIEDNFEYAYIMKHGCYYRDGYCGYTNNIGEAGVYLSKEARSHA